MAGLGVGLALLKAAELDLELARMWGKLTSSRMVWSPGIVFEVVVEYALVAGLPLGAGLTPFCLFLQPKGRPGYVACLIATALIVPSLAITGVLVQLTGSPPIRFVGQQLLPALLAGAGIVASWLTMRLFGVWDPEPTWSDRMGRALGALWIVMGAVCGYIVLTVLH
jgi:hypothetical protein